MADEKIELDNYHWHEALDRASIVTEFVETHLLEHPAIQQTPQLKVKVDAAVALLADTYQLIGQLSLTE